MGETTREVRFFILKSGLISAINGCWHRRQAGQKLPSATDFCGQKTVDALLRSPFQIDRLRMAFAAICAPAAMSWRAMGGYCPSITVGSLTTQRIILSLAWRLQCPLRT